MIRNMGKKVSGRALALLLAVLIAPASMGAAPVDPTDPNRQGSGLLDSSCYVIHDSKDSDPSSVTVKAKGGTIISPDDNGNYTDVPDGAQLTIRYAFELKDSNGKEGGDYEEYTYREGDYILFDLPGGLTYHKVDGKTFFFTDDGLEKAFGKLDVIPGGTSGGTAKFTFTEDAAERPGLSGWFELSAEISDENQETGTPITVEFGSTTVKITPEATPPAIGVEKDGAYDADTNQITWTVKVAPPDGKTVAGVSVVDQYGGNQTYVENSFEVKDSGNRPIPLETGDLAVDESNRTITYTFPGPISGTQTLTYKTEPKPGSFGEEDGSSSKSTFDNTATVYVKNVENNHDDAAVSLDWIDKKPGTVDLENKTVTWSVEAGIDGKTITGALIKDSLPEGLELDTDSVVTWKAPGEGTTATKVSRDTTTNPPDEGEYYYNEDTRTLIYNAGELKGRGTLTYTAKITGNNLLASLEDNGNITLPANKAELSWNELKEGEIGPSDTDQAKVGPGGLISKSSTAAATDGHYDNSLENGNVINWTIVVNRNRVELQNVSVTDTLGAGQEYVENSFKVDDKDPAQGKLTWTRAGETATGFTYDFDNITKQYTITYQTKITDKSLLYANGTVSFGNTVTLNENGKTINIDAPQKFNSQVLDKAVATAYNYNTRQIEWQITVNRNNLDLTNATVTDDIPAGMTYVEGSLTVDNQSPEKSVAVTTDENSNQHVSYTLGNIEKQCVVRLKTQLSDELVAKWPGESKDFENKATLSTDNYGQIDVKKSTVIYFPIAAKTAERYEAGNDYIGWKVEINASLFNLGKGLALTDNLPEELALDPDSVSICPATVSNNGATVTEDTEHPLTKGQDYTVGIEGQKVTFRFAENFEVTTAYVLRFSTDITKAISSVTNSISLTLSGSTAPDTTSSKKVENININGGGAAGGASITVQKKDGDGQSLSGATFRLLDIHGRQVGDSDQITDEEGEAVFSGNEYGLLYHKYYIEEVAPPEGYLLSADKPGVRLSSNTKNPTVEFTDQKALGTVEIKKQKPDGTPLAGAEFKLTGKDYAENTVEKTAFSADDGGMVTFTEVPLGNYEIRETGAPAGYLRTDTVWKAEVRYNDNKTGVETVYGDGKTEEAPTVTDAAAKAGFSFTKFREDGKTPLAGAKFTLYDTDGLPTDFTATSGEDGAVTFENVPLGTYEVYETKAPDGYLQKTDAVFSVAVQYADGGRTGVKTVYTLPGGETAETPPAVTNKRKPSNPGGGDNGGGGDPGGGGDDTPSSSTPSSSVPAPSVPGGGTTSGGTTPGGPNEGGTVPGGTAPGGSAGGGNVGEGTAHGGTGKGKPSAGPQTGDAGSPMIPMLAAILAAAAAVFTGNLILARRAKKSKKS